MVRKSVFSAVACVTIAAALGGCTKFTERWDSTPALMTANPSALMVGKWEGTWQSDVTDYKGDIRAIATAAGITVDDRKTVQQYTVELQFFYQRVPYEEFTVTFNAVKGDDNRLRFTGKKDLGKYKGGVTQFEGYVDPEKDILYLDYVNNKDAGTYLMQRKVLENL